MGSGRGEEGRGGLDLVEADLGAGDDHAHLHAHLEGVRHGQVGDVDVRVPRELLRVGDAPVQPRRRGDHVL
eukprot:3512921-Rhodomonas_salina.1